MVWKRTKKREREKSSSISVPALVARGIQTKEKGPPGRTTKMEGKPTFVFFFFPLPTRTLFCNSLHTYFSLPDFPLLSYLLKHTYKHTFALKKKNVLIDSQTRKGVGRTSVNEQRGLFSGSTVERSLLPHRQLFARPWKDVQAAVAHDGHCFPFPSAVQRRSGDSCG